ncbi:MAG: SAM-dependent methyltransferase, partial [Dehalococcoidia bacterium]
VGCFLSNELVDSFPVHRVAVIQGELQEVHVGCEGGRLVEVLGPPSTQELRRYFQRLSLLPGEGCRAEVNLAALRWMKSVGEALERGIVITFDYGYEAAELYAPWRRDGTLLCFYRHAASADPFARLGYQDMTAHVDFTGLVEQGRRWGLEPLALITQARFLIALGIGAGLRPALAAGRADLEEYYARRRAVLELTDPARLGRIKVLLQAKGVAGCEGLWCLKQAMAGVEEANGP